jgi:hypothetical protein
MKEVPEHFEWVTAQLNCNTKQLFDDLAGRVEADVAARMTNRSPDEQRLTFTFQRPADEQRNGEGYFSVVCDRKNHVVRFLLRAGVISITREVNRVNNMTRDVRVRLNEVGECRFVVGGEPGEKTAWQISRDALHDTFFV